MASVKMLLEAGADPNVRYGVVSRDKMFLRFIPL
jgi:hypothetical protein